VPAASGDGDIVEARQMMTFVQASGRAI
jgi:hypothetical protein